VEKTILLADHVVTMDDAYTVHSPGFLRLEGNTIVDVGSGSPDPEPGEQVLDFGGKLLMPGLVNAHTHTPMILFRGMAEGVSLFTMDGFLNTLRRFEAQIDETMIGGAVACSCAEMIRTGTTCFADQYFYANTIFDEVSASGLRGVLAYGIVELGDPVRREQELASAEAFLGRCASDVDGRVTGWIGPHAFFVDNSEQLIAREIDLARRYGVGFHIHFATSNEENDYCVPRFGLSAIQKMEELGIMDVRTLAAHSITVSDEDIRAMARHPFYPVMSPSAAMRSGFPAAPVKAMLEAGVTVALGTDNVCNSNSYDLFTEMGVGAKLIIHREQDAAAIAARDLVTMATRSGARALGLEESIGSLEPGKRADLIALDMDAMGWGPLEGQDLYTQMVYSIHGTDVADTMVDGRWLMRDKKLVTLNYGERLAELNGQRHLLLERLGSGA